MHQKNTRLASPNPRVLATENCELSESTNLLRAVVLLFYACCVTNYCKPVGLKEQPFIIVSAAQGSRRHLTWSSVQLLTRLQWRCWLGCILIWILGSSSKLIQVIDRFPFLVVVGVRFSTLRLDTIPLYRQFTAWLFASSRSAGEGFSCFEFVLPGKTWSF